MKITHCTGRQGRGQGIYSGLAFARHALFAVVYFACACQNCAFAAAAQGGETYERSDVEQIPDSGLPRGLQGRNIRNYTSRDFLRYVAQWEPDTPIPAPYLYSNASVGLLGYLVAIATGKPWAQLVRDEITGPLTMADTVMRLNDEQRGRLAQGHRPNGSPAPEWPIVAWYAAGALRSTVADMLNFGEANLGHTKVNGQPVPPALTAAMQLAQQSRYTSENGVQHAMSWEIVNANSEKMIEKNGGTAGFNSLILLAPSKDLAIFLVANQSKSEVNQVGRQIAHNLH